MTTFKFKTAEEANSDSAEITWEEAQPLINDYYNRPDALKVQLPSGDITTLKAYRFAGEHVRRLLDQPNVTDLYLMFATSPTDSKNITIIAGGVMDAQMTGGELEKGLLYDYCEPCPNKCPSNM